MQSDFQTQIQSTALFERAMLAEQNFPTSTLYIVGLPIGNAADITLRALWILANSDVIACEDTRESKKLLDRYLIATPTMAVHEHNEREAAQKLIARLRAGERVALVTDAGTPAVSDPGAKVVQSVRAEGFAVMPVPGACAAVTALSAAGLDAYSFTFAGFVPPQAKARDERLRTLVGRGEAFVIYEAPHRLIGLLTSLSEMLESDRRIVVCRELTKRFESFYELTGETLKTWLTSHDPKGEYAIFVDERKHAGLALDESVMKWARAINSELPQSKTAALVAKVTGLKRDIVYEALMDNK